MPVDIAIPDLYWVTALTAFVLIPSFAHWQEFYINRIKSQGRPTLKTQLIRARRDQQQYTDQKTQIMIMMLFGGLAAPNYAFVPGFLWVFFRVLDWVDYVVLGEGYDVEKADAGMRSNSMSHGVFGILLVSCLQTIVRLWGVMDGPVPDVLEDLGQSMIYIS